MLDPSSNITVLEQPAFACGGRCAPFDLGSEPGQRLQQLFFHQGIAFDRNRFNRTAVTAPLFSYLAPSEDADEKMVSRVGIEPTTRR